MQVLQAQMAAFYSNPLNLDFDGLSYFLKKYCKENLNIIFENSQGLPFIPKEAPAEIPRLQLVSENQKVKIQCSLVRFDLFYEHNTAPQQHFDFELFSSLVKGVIHAHNSINQKILRVGLVAIGAIESKNPNRYIIDKFFNPEKIPYANELSDAMLSFNKPFQKEGIHLNCVTNYSVGQSVQGEETILIKQIDVNTGVKDDFSSHQKINEILQAFKEKIEDPE